MSTASTAAGEGATNGAGALSCWGAAAKEPVLSAVGPLRVSVRPLELSARSLRALGVSASPDSPAAHVVSTAAVAGVTDDASVLLAWAPVVVALD